MLKSYTLPAPSSVGFSLSRNDLDVTSPVVSSTLNRAASVPDKEKVPPAKFSLNEASAVD